MSTTAPGDTAYKTWLGHIQRCAACCTGAACPAAAKLARAWREARG
ncbi:hypothetical protein [Streptomyces microflavus]|nr:hypothetical protein [Streptomyces sp. MBT57]